jgi:hypothetical protein
MAYASPVTILRPCQPSTRVITVGSSYHRHSSPRPPRVMAPRLESRTGDPRLRKVSPVSSPPHCRTAALIPLALWANQKGQKSHTHITPLPQVSTCITAPFPFARASTSIPGPTPTLPNTQPARSRRPPHTSRCHQTENVSECGSFQRQTWSSGGVALWRPRKHSSVRRQKGTTPLNRVRHVPTTLFWQQPASDHPEKTSRPIPANSTAQQRRVVDVFLTTVSPR